MPIRTAGVLFCLLAVGAYAQKAEIKDEALASRRAVPATIGQPVIVLSNKSPRIIRRPNATYIAPYFDSLILGDGDSLTIHGGGSNEDEAPRTFTYTKANAPAGPFWAVAIPGDTANIDLDNVSGTAKYTIGKYVAGLKEAQRRDGRVLQICGNEDDTRPAKCYETDGAIYDRSRAVARLLINGSRSCTGWLVGDAGHLLTNEHCIQSQADADSVDVEFMAEGTTCTKKCGYAGACPGTVVTKSAKLVACDRALDYALLLLDPSVPQQYGFFRLRSKTGTEKDERIYIPQHPLGKGKRLVLMSDDPLDKPKEGAEAVLVEGRPVTRISHLDAESCEGGGPPEIGYRADTEEGSSGAPVVATKDNLVIGLHHCGGCPNRAIPIRSVIAAIKQHLPASAYGD